MTMCFCDLPLGARFRLPGRTVRCEKVGPTRYREVDGSFPEMILLADDGLLVEVPS